MKKEYYKPRVIKVKLHVEQTVLDNCKTTGTAGSFQPIASACRTAGVPCDTIAS